MNKTGKYEKEGVSRKRRGTGMIAYTGERITVNNFTPSLIGIITVVFL